MPLGRRNVCFGSLADLRSRRAIVRFVPIADIIPLVERERAIFIERHILRALLSHTDACRLMSPTDPQQETSGCVERTSAFAKWRQGRCRAD